MNILKKLFGGGDNSQHRDGSGMYFYVKLHRCNDVTKVRVDMNNDLSLNDEGSGYWVRKMVSNSNYKCAKAELSLYFDMNRKLQNSEVQGGQLVNREEFDQWTAAQQKT